MILAIADYRWRGHRLAHIAAIRRLLDASGAASCICLPREGFESREALVHLSEFGGRDFIHTGQSVPLDLDSWISLVVQAGVAHGAKAFLFPWADRLLPFLIKAFARWPDLHFHALLGRVAPGVVEEGRASARAMALAELFHISTRQTKSDVSALCSPLDPLVNSDGIGQYAGLRWVTDPITVNCSPHRGMLDQLKRFSAGAPLAVMIGDLSSRKLSYDVVRQWERVYAATKIRLVIAGRIDESADRLHSIAVDSRIVYRSFGYLSDQELHSCIAAASVVLATFREGTYAPSGISTLATYYRVPSAIKGNDYLSRIMRYHDIGAPIDLASSSGVVNLGHLAERKCASLIQSSYTYEDFLSQWLVRCTDCFGG